jgi:hypothetical protein
LDRRLALNLQEGRKLKMRLDVLLSLIRSSLNRCSFFSVMVLRLDVVRVGSPMNRNERLRFLVLVEMTYGRRDS